MTIYEELYQICGHHLRCACKQLESTLGDMSAEQADKIVEEAIAEIREVGYVLDGLAKAEKYQATDLDHAYYTCGSNNVSST